MFVTSITLNTKLAITEATGELCATSEEEAYLWVFSITGQLQNFVLAKNTVLEAFKIESYNTDFINKLMNYSAKNLIRSLNLPKPENK